MPFSYHSELRWMLALAGLLTACEHQGLNRGSPKTNGGNPGVYDAGDGACSATCSTPPGTIQLYEGNAASNDELWAGLIGVWQICSRAYEVFLAAPSDTIGVEFAPPSTEDASVPQGNLFFLTRGPSGPVRGGGFDYQQTYEVDRGVLYCHTSYSSGLGFSIKYSPCPREWQVDATNATYLSAGSRRRATLVPF